MACGPFFKHIWATLLLSDSKPKNHNHLILCFHSGAYDDPRHALLCDLQFFLSTFDPFYLQFSHHYIHIFTVIYFNSLLLFGHYSFIACRAFGCFKPSHWVPFQQLNVSILFVFLLHHNVILAYYFMAVTACRYSSYFDNPFFSTYSFRVYIPT